MLQADFSIDRTEPEKNGMASLQYWKKKNSQAEFKTQVKHFQQWCEIKKFPNHQKLIDFTTSKPKSK